MHEIERLCGVRLVQFKNMDKGCDLVYAGSYLILEFFSAALS